MSFLAEEGSPTIGCPESVFSVSCDRVAMSSLQLDPDRALPFPAEQRSIAGEIYGETKELPLVCMHGHVEPEVFADDLPFADRAAVDRSRSLRIPDAGLTRHRARSPWRAAAG